jgi:MFS family permease
VGSGLGTVGLIIFEALLASERSNDKAISYGSLLVCYWAIALGFNLSSTVCVSLLSKQLPCERNRWAGLVVQLSMWIGRATGTVLGRGFRSASYNLTDDMTGGSSVKIGMMNFVGVQIAIVGLGVLCFLGLWRDLKTKKG